MAGLDLSILEGPTLVPGEAATAPLTFFEEDPNQPRTEIEGASFEAFVEDVRQHGILQPIVVVRSKTGKLRIRFGARRFRAAKVLKLTSIPYVLATDPRHLDDYTQVSENEQRKSLEPMELANFIERRIKGGESQTEIAKRLGVARTTVVFLHTLVDAPAFIKGLYQADVCRSPKFLYRLTRLWEKNASLVEDRVTHALEITTSFIDSLTAEVDPKPESSLAQPLPSLNPSETSAFSATDDLRPKTTSPANLDAPRPSSVERPAPVPVRATKPRTQTGVSSPSSPQLRTPGLFGRHADRDVTLLIFKAPSVVGKVHIRFQDNGAELEVPCVEVYFTRLTETAL